MGWQLAPGTGFCEISGELVFLDLGRDKYLALRGEDRAAFERLRRREPNDSEAMTRLAGTGLIKRSDGPVSIEPAQIDVPPRDLSAREDGFNLAMTLGAARALRWAKRAMRPERIAGTIEDLRAKKALAIRESVDGAENIAALYAACRWILPTVPRCLVDALALDRILLARGLRVSLVFGVRLAPFAAHCWLQSPSAVLTGTVAEARNYTPILVVE